MKDGSAPITLQGFAALLLWLAEEKVGNNPDPAILCWGLPQGRLLHATLECGDGDGSTRLEAVIQDQTDGKERSRYFDPAGLFVTRWLMLAGLPLRIDRNTPYYHTVAIGDHVILWRILADAQPGRIVKQIVNHHDLRRQNFRLTTANALRAEGLEVGNVRKGREEITEEALVHLPKIGDELKAAGLPPIDAEFYLQRLQDGFALLDTIHLGPAKSDPETDEGG